MQLDGVDLWRYGRNPNNGIKGKVLGTGQARKKGGLRHGSGQKRGVFTAAHTCTGHICECPPPPGRLNRTLLTQMAMPLTSHIIAQMDLISGFGN